MAHNPGAGAALLFEYSRRVGKDRIFATEYRRMADRMGCNTQSVIRAVGRLEEAGSIEHVGVGRYRITGIPYVPAKPGKSNHYVDFRAKPRPDALRPLPAPCSYATARACGIEPIASRRVGDKSGGVGRGGYVITLARIPSLERPLP